MRLIIAILSFIVLNGVIGKSQSADGSAEGNVNAGGFSMSANSDANDDANGDANEANGSPSLRNDKNNPSKSYTYEINAKRTDQTIAPGFPIIYMYYQISPVQNITYFQQINEDNPFIIEAIVLHDDSIIFEESLNSPNPIKSCDKLDDNSWRYVLLEMTVKGIMPDGKCPVDKGSYNINQELEPITVTFDSMIRCGDYEIFENVYAGDTWAGQIGYDFNIPENDNCIS